jgi:ATP-dependent DNA helicase RecQ
MKTPLSLLQHYWNHSEFRTGQLEAIQAILEGNDTFVLMPTGGGKSVCYQIPALLKEGICIVVSPLIALMSDQVNQLKAKGIKAVQITGGISADEISTLLDNCSYGNYKFLYLSPERIQQEWIVERLKTMEVSMVAVDEAHCVSQWGHDFRPAYQKITVLREALPKCAFMALTASATPKVAKEIIEELSLHAPVKIQTSFYRSNLAYKTLFTEDKMGVLLSLLKKNMDAVIVYTRNRRSTETVADQLNRLGVAALYFHGGLSTQEKNKRLKLWMNEKKNVMVATTAFGMGIDKTNVRKVIHLSLPESLESYYQEAGRAGRDGKPAESIILIDPLDKEAVKNQFINQLPTVETTFFAYRKLCNYFQLGYGEGTGVTFPFQFNAFCKTYQLPATKTYQILKLLDREGILQFSGNFKEQNRVQITLSNQGLFDYMENHTSSALLLKTLLRMYGGLFERLTRVDLDEVSKKTNRPKNELTQKLLQLEKENIVLLDRFETDTEITFLVPREDEQTLHPIARDIKSQYATKKGMIQSMIDFIENQQLCKSVQLAAYFGEKLSDWCGVCSVCKDTFVENKKQITKIIREEILELLEKKSLNSEKISTLLPYKINDLLDVLDQLVNEEKLIVDSKNQYRLHQ